MSSDLDLARGGSGDLEEYYSKQEYEELYLHFEPFLTHLTTYEDKLNKIYSIQAELSDKINAEFKKASVVDIIGKNHMYLVEGSYDTDTYDLVFYPDADNPAHALIMLELQYRLPSEAGPERGRYPGHMMNPQVPEVLNHCFDTEELNFFVDYLLIALTQTPDIVILGKPFREYFV